MTKAKDKDTSGTADTTQVDEQAKQDAAKAAELQTANDEAKKLGFKDAEDQKAKNEAAQAEGFTDHADMVAKKTAAARQARDDKEASDKLAREAAAASSTAGLTGTNNERPEEVQHHGTLRHDEPPLIIRDDVVLNTPRSREEQIIATEQALADLNDNNYQNFAKHEDDHADEEERRIAENEEARPTSGKARNRLTPFIDKDGNRHWR